MTDFKRDDRVQIVFPCLGLTTPWPRAVGSYKGRGSNVEMTMTALVRLDCTYLDVRAHLDRFDIPSSFRLVWFPPLGPHGVRVRRSMLRPIDPITDLGMLA